MFKKRGLDRVGVKRKHREIDTEELNTEEALDMPTSAALNITAPLASKRAKKGLSATQLLLAAENQGNTEKESYI